MLAEKTALLTFEFQLYTIILDFNSSGDALFLHTPHPDNDQFPFEVETLSTTSTLTNKALDDYINQIDKYEKLYGPANQAFCLLYIKSVGEPF